MRTFWYAGWLLLTGLVLFACQSGDLNLGQSIINPLELQIQSVDTVTIQTSTVMRPDSFITSGDPSLLLGQWTDAKTGKMTARNFTSVNFVSNPIAGQTGLQLDSLVLEFNYGYVYGDTTSQFSFSVNQLQRPINAQLYYNTNSLPYQATPIAQKSVLLQPVTKTKLIQLRLSDALAQTFFAKLSNSEINDYTTLTNFLPGYALTCTSTANTFIGITANTSGLRLYYHTTDINQTSSSVLFPFSGVYFTQLRNDLTGTPLSALKTRFDAVSSRLTDNTTFVVPAAQLETRIEFPYLEQFARPGGFADLNKALLVVSPVRRDFLDNTPPPSLLALYFTNGQNDLLSTALPGGIGGTSAAAATYYSDPTALTLSDTYTFDLTYYIGQIIKRRSSSQPLILTIPATSTQITLQERIRRVVLGNQQRPNDQLKMRLFFTSGS